MAGKAMPSRCGLPARYRVHAEEFREVLATLFLVAFGSVATGLGCGALLLLKGELLQYRLGTFLPALEAWAGGPWQMIWAYCGLHLATCLFVDLLRHAMPSARGGGFMEVKLAIAKHETLHAQDVWSGLARWTGAQIYSFGGGVLDVETPIIYLTAALSERIFVLSRVRTRIRDFYLAMGCANGFALAFNSPLGGSLQAMEELVDSPQSKFGIAVLCVGVSISAFTAHWILKQRDASLAVAEFQYAFDGQLKPSVFASIPLGIVCGLAAHGFSRLCITLRGRARQSRLYPVAATLNGVVLCACLLLLVFLQDPRTLLADPGQALSGAGRQFVPVHAAGSSFTYLRGFLGDARAGEGVLEGNLAVWRLVLCVVARFLLTAVGVGTSAPGGLLGPCLAIGGGIGALAHALLGAGDDSRYFVVSGAAGFFAAVTHLHSAVLALAIDCIAGVGLNDHAVVGSVALSISCAYLVANYLCPLSLLNLMLLQDGGDLAKSKEAESDDELFEDLGPGRELPQLPCPSPPPDPRDAPASGAAFSPAVSDASSPRSARTTPRSEGLAEGIEVRTGEGFGAGPRAEPRDLPDYVVPC